MVFLKGFPEIYPIFHLFFREEGENSAQSYLPTVTGKRGFKAQRASSLILI